MAVPHFQVDHRLCLNGFPVPVETKTMVIVDPLALGDTNSLNLPIATEVNLVSFKASGDMNWLCKSLQLPGGDGSNYNKGRWWAHNCFRVPLLIEIKEAIKKIKQLKRASLQIISASFSWRSVDSSCMCGTAAQLSPWASPKSLVPSMSLTQTLTLWSGSAPSCRRTLMSSYLGILKRWLSLRMQNMRSK